MFSDALDPARDHLEPGRSVVLTVEATVEGDELRLLAKSAQPIDVAAAGAAGVGLRIYVNDEAAAPSLATRLAGIARNSGAPAQGAGQPRLDASRASPARSRSRCPDPTR